jgi:glyoxylase-like metal-dependent hydrolase (beta-lactamase superfamily II)
MKTVSINNRISYIESADDPLSAEIGIIKAESGIWLFDVGNGEANIEGLSDRYNIVLSHFHADHTGNIEKLNVGDLYVSKTTYDHVHAGTVVNADIFIDDMHIFPLPSSHTKGCLGLEVDETCAFVGDALYSKVKDGFYIYNAQLLKEEIEVLSALKAPYLLVSHYEGFVRKKEEALDELKEIYGQRVKNTPDILIPMNMK